MYFCWGKFYSHYSLGILDTKVCLASCILWVHDTRNIICFQTFSCENNKHTFLCRIWAWNTSSANDVYVLKDSEKTFLTYYSDICAFIIYYFLRHSIHSYIGAAEFLWLHDILTIQCEILHIIISPHFFFRFSSNLCGMTTLSQCQFSILNT